MLSPLIGEHLHLREVPVFLREIEPIADHELGIDAETDIVGLERNAARFWLIEKRGRLHRRRSTALDVAKDLAHGETAVDDVLDDENRSAAHVELRLLEDGYHPGGVLLVAVGRDLDEVQGNVEGHLPHQVGAEEYC